MTEHDFMLEQQRAVERMKKMAENSNNKNRNQQNNSNSEEKPSNSGGFLNLNGLNIPFLDNLKNDKDTGLILGLILILLCENCDKLLLLALVYILI